MQVIACLSQYLLAFQNYSAINSTGAFCHFLFHVVICFRNLSLINI